MLLALTKVKRSGGVGHAREGRCGALRESGPEEPAYNSCGLEGSLCRHACSAVTSCSPRE